MQLYLGVWVVFSLLPAFGQADVLIGEEIVEGGLHPDDVPAVVSVQIMESGLIRMLERYRGGRDVTTALGSLSPELVEKFRSQAADIPQGNLVFQDPDAPGCFDAPSMTGRVLNGAGELVPLYGAMQCKSRVREDGVGSELNGVLQGLRGMAALARN